MIQRRRPMLAAGPVFRYCRDLEAENEILVKSLRLVADAASVDPAKHQSVVLLSKYAGDMLDVVEKMRINCAKAEETS